VLGQTGHGRWIGLLPVVGWAGRGSRAWIRGREEEDEILVIRVRAQAELRPLSTAFLLLEDVGAEAARAATKSGLTSTTNVHNRL
jgi:hypothetical protein